MMGVWKFVWEKNDMKFSVYDNGKPAKYPECKVNYSWDNNTFNTFEEAQKYARMWLGEGCGGS